MTHLAARTLLDKNLKVVLGIFWGHLTVPTSELLFTETDTLLETQPVHTFSKTCANILMSGSRLLKEAVKFSQGS